MMSKRKEYLHLHTEQWDIQNEVSGIENNGVDPQPSKLVSFSSSISAFERKTTNPEASMGSSKECGKCET